LSEDEFTNNQCNDCGKVFDSSFELIDHVLDDDEEFDPYYALPSGYKLLLGSLLRFLYGSADNPEQIKHITQSTYVTLFAAENGYDLVDELIEEMVIKSALKDFDSSLKRLLEEEADNEGEE
jgi:hypothetical protein